MRKDADLQINFLNRIKDIIPESASLADELADVLEISTDSVYRRLRGETLLTVNEVYELCTHYRISFDLFTHRAKNIAFHYDELKSPDGFHTYLSTIFNDMKQIARTENKQIIYAAIDVPIFHHFKYPELSAFKMFYWMKAVVGVPLLDGKKFSVSHVSPEFAEIGKEIYEVYQNIPSIEIWTDETINSLIKQIEFYWDAGYFETQDDALTVCSQAREEIDTLNKQAEMSSKKMKLSDEGSFMLYHSHIEIGNNCIFTKKGEIESVYLSVHTFNKITTGNPGFVQDSRAWLENLIKKSDLISGISQVNRYQFFKRASDKLDRLYEKISENK
ncbi:MAG: hypothetical protein J7K64_04030 [Bacteroidales bacterium]|nr:hypothetical protein [Bacteroidales bacterium]